MTLGERIALARKKAGLSQEQLGDRLGVSRQAVSKWESDQTNPDVAYVAQMCRLLEVSSDWLLLGEEREADGAPRRCPHCQGVVTGLEKFCPSCGQSLAEEEIPNNARYNLFLWVTRNRTGTQDALRKFYRELPRDRNYILPACLETEPVRFDITLAENTPALICGHADRDAALQAQALLASCAELRTYPEEAGKDWLCLNPGDRVDSLSTESGPPEPPLSFGMVVLAVILGIMIVSFL